MWTISEVSMRLHLMVKICYSKGCSVRKVAGNRSRGVWTGVLRPLTRILMTISIQNNPGVLGLQQIYLQSYRMSLSEEASLSYRLVGLYGGGVHLRCILPCNKP